MRPIDQYRSNRVDSASKSQIVTMLFQEIGRRLEMALDANDRGSHEWRGHLHHVREILIELRMALDFEAAPELCKTLASLYDWESDELISAGRDQAARRIRGVIRVNEQLLEGWIGALERVASQEASATP